LQREIILRLLRQAGPEGVSKAVLIFDKHYTQAAARVWELEQAGVTICHEMRPGDRYVTFVLVSEPAEAQPKTADWYEETTGKPRATSPNPKPLPVYAQRSLPLFDAAP
jgi:hypothetical protein